MVEKLPRSYGRILGFQLSGRLDDHDYSEFVPLVEATIAEFGAVRLLAQFHDFRGWDPHALWDDIKFSSRHCLNVERIALVGNQKWGPWVAAICRPFTRATIRYFNVADEQQAWDWLESDE